jgi:hypothetical protein
LPLVIYTTSQLCPFLIYRIRGQRREGDNANNLLECLVAKRPCEIPGMNFAVVGVEIKGASLGQSQRMALAFIIISHFIQSLNTWF